MLIAQRRDTSSVLVQAFEQVLIEQNHVKTHTIWHTVLYNKNKRFRDLQLAVFIYRLHTISGASFNKHKVFPR